MKKIAIGLLVMSYCLVGTTAFGEGIDNYTVLMLHSDGVQGSTNFIDDSFSGHTVTPGGAFIDTNQKKFGAGSASFGGSGGYFTIPDSSDWSFGTEDFTIDAWVKFSFFGDYNVLCAANHQTNANQGWIFSVPNPNRISFYPDFSRGFAFDGSTLSTGIWHHIAAVRSGDVLKMYLNGEQYDIARDIAGLSCDAPDNSYLYAGVYRGAGLTTPLNGYIDEFRISKGIARWTSDFTPPIEPYSTHTPDTLISTFLLGDLDLNGRVDSSDLGTFINSFGNSNMNYLRGDTNGDNRVDLDDFATLRSNYDMDNIADDRTTALYHGNDLILTVYTDSHKDVHVYQGRGFFTINELLDASMLNPGDFIVKTYANGAQLTFDHNGWPVLNSTLGEDPDALETVLTVEALENLVENGIVEEGVLVDNPTIQGDQETLARLAVAEELIAIRNTKNLTYYNELKSKSKYLDWLKS